MSEQRVNKAPDKTMPQMVRRMPRPSSAPSYRGELHPILQLQRAIGNQAVNRLLQAGQLQAKLAVSQPDDIYEQEADRIADQVMRMPALTLTQVHWRTVA